MNDLKSYFRSRFLEPWYKRRWWLNKRKCKVYYYSTIYGIYHTPLYEIYVPLWAWPLELIHRLFFGVTKIKPKE